MDGEGAEEALRASGLPAGSPTPSQAVTAWRASALTRKAKDRPRAMSGSRSGSAMQIAARRRAAAASAAAMTAVVTGRISTRTPRGRASQYGSMGRSRVSMEFGLSMGYVTCRIQGTPR